MLADMDEDVAESPYQVTVLPGPPSAQHSVIDGPGRRAAIAGSAASFEIEARDAHGNRYISCLYQLTDNCSQRPSVSKACVDCSITYQALYG